MMVTYKCKCGYEFDGHWHKARVRRALMPRHKDKADMLLCMICPSCGDTRGKKNIDSDEVFHDFAEGGEYGFI